MKPGRVLSLALLGLAGATLASGVLLSHARHQHRTQFRAMQTLIAQRDQLEVEWGALQLERATWVGYRRIDREARERLGMRQPQRQDIVFLRIGPMDSSPRTSSAGSR